MLSSQKYICVSVEPNYAPMNVLAATSGSLAFDFQFVIHPCQRQHIADMIFTFLSCFSSISAHHSLHLENAFMFIFSRIGDADSKSRFIL